jgi:hypothetical protein
MYFYNILSDLKISTVFRALSSNIKTNENLFVRPSIRLITK